MKLVNIEVHKDQNAIQRYSLASQPESAWVHAVMRLLFQKFSTFYIIIDNGVLQFGREGLGFVYAGFKVDLDVQIFVNLQCIRIAANCSNMMTMFRL